MIVWQRTLLRDNKKTITYINQNPESQKIFEQRAILRELSYNEAVMSVSSK